jgi:hypothetical protein
VKVLEMEDISASSTSERDRDQPKIIFFKVVVVGRVGPSSKDV